MWKWSAAGFALIATAAVTAILGSTIWVRRRTPAARSLAVVIAAAAWWSFAYALEISASDLQTLWRFGDAKYLGIVALPAAWVVFTLRFTGRGHLVTRGRIAALTVIPIVTLALLSNEASHDLIRQYPIPTAEMPRPPVVVGPLYWVYFIYAYILMLGGAVLLVATFLGLPAAYRMQAAALAIAVVLPIVGNVLYNFRVGPFDRLDPTPFLFLLTAVLLAWGVARFGLLDLVPVARDMIVERINDGIVVLDDGRRIIDLNAAAQRFLSVSGTVVGEPIGRLVPAVVELLDRHGDNGDAHLELSVGSDVGPRTYDVTVCALRTSHASAGGHLLVLHDVTEARLAQQHLQRLAHHDPLTGLPNRKLLFDLLDSAVAGAASRRRSLGVLFCDLDRFKRINDSLGHDAGDTVLRTVAARLSQRLRGGDAVARLSGDEFVVVLSEIDEPSAAERVAAALLDVVTAPLRVAGSELHLTMSVGVAVYPFDALDATALIRLADHAMYRAKAAGRNRICSAAGLADTTDAEHLALENELRDAHRNGELELWYQPCVGLIDGGVVAMEALLRWRHPRLGLLGPGRFIHLAEDGDVIHELGAWVVQEACRAGAAWKRAGHDVVVSVNCSAREISRPGLSQQVYRALEHSGLEPARLQLEVTETAMLDESPPTAALLVELQRVGVGIAIDDFGTGYTSLRQLRHYPLSAVKIDRSFVAGLGRRDEDRAIVSAMVHLAHDLGLRVIAEGVETTQQRDVLAELGCDAGQGFLFAKPQPLEAATGLLR